MVPSARRRYPRSEDRSRDLNRLKQKIDIYHSANVRVQPGGIFFEYAAKLN